MPKTSDAPDMVILEEARAIFVPLEDAETSPEVLDEANCCWRADTVTELVTLIGMSASFKPA